MAELELRRYKAMREADTESLDRLLAEDLSYTHSDGVTDSKKSYLLGVQAGKWKYRNIERHDHDIRIFRELAVITGDIHIDVDIEGIATHLNCRFLCIWQQKSEGWKMVVWQATRRLTA
ncbi:nuclear transport factor 2 family protein [Marinobacterium aestuariivivens]|uniref:Nuclear transport factor 2 family protein n=1 Tax=Marinobacterium aestuariivivens TaxID=1698799 RepID=A0ABW2A5H4_9GAMM